MKWMNELMKFLKYPQQSVCQKQFTILWHIEILWDYGW